MEALKQIIPGTFEIKVIIDLESTSTHAIVLDSLFETKADLENYQINPEHKKAGEFIRSVLTARVCLDFEE